MVVILAFTVAIVLPTGMCTFNPGKPEAGPVQEADPAAFLDMEARATGFPVLLPSTPEGWTPNSARRKNMDNSPAPTIGYVTADMGFLQLVQTGLEATKAVDAYDGNRRELEETRTVDGVEVQVYTSKDADIRDLWVFETPVNTALISGVAEATEFETLVAATLKADVVDTNN